MRFTIRDLLWLTVVAAMGLGWYLEHRHHLDHVRRAAEQSVNAQQVNTAVERWYSEKGIWPADDLSDIGSDPNYFPNGLPVNPATGGPFSLHPTSHRAR